MSRVGVQVSRRFKERVAALGLTPSDAATLRALARGGPASQRELARRLNLVPSRLVVVVDALESRGLVVRQPNAGDRRRYDVTLTDAGHDVLLRMRDVAAEHEKEFTAGLTRDEVATLLRLLGRIQETVGITGEGHPGMR